MRILIVDPMKKNSPFIIKVISLMKNFVLQDELHNKLSSSMDSHKNISKYRCNVDWFKGQGSVPVGEHLTLIGGFT